LWLAWAGPVLAEAHESLVVAGWAETALLLPSKLELAAKLDSGAENSSLNIERLRYFKRGGQRWVRFTVEGDGGRRVAFERRVLRKAAIKRHGEGSHIRPVVAMEICLGDTVKEVEVNLVDRSRFEYPLLIGRSFLAEDFLIDTSATDLRPLTCTEASRK
jgi:hypothetical protein